tara:strand:+ start:401 stop:898 length:498 start_codon:yes stop_codon:yes gene_type:complete
MSKSKTKNTTKSSKNNANKLLADNRFAKYQYEILETLETGIELLGTEVKSIRAGNTNLRDGFCLIRNGELHLHNVHISRIKNAGHFFNHDPLRTRKLLAHKKEIFKLEGQVNKKGLSLIPLSLHLKGSWVKVKIGLGKGRKLYDKRENEKRKQEKKEVKSALERF